MFRLRFTCVLVLGLGCPGVHLSGLAQVPAAPAAVPAAPAVADEPVRPPTVIYPAEAKERRIQGIVELEVSVDATGKVTEAKALSGPAELRQAAVDAYLKAEYRPLMRDGRPVPAVVRTSVNFALQVAPPSGDVAVAKEFDPMHARCQDLSRQHSPDAFSTCQQALELGNRFTEKSHLEERAQSYNDLVVLLIQEKRYNEASVLGEEVVPLIAVQKPVSEAAATAYITRAETRSLTKDLKGSDADCRVAEEMLNTLLPNEKEVDRAANFRNQLRETMLLHSVVLEKLHRNKEARQLADKARFI